MIMMKKFLVLFLLVMTCTTAAGQDVYSGSTSLVDIDREWETETLKGATDGSLIAMLDCFNKRWPTWMVISALKT